LIDKSANHRSTESMTAVQRRYCPPCPPSFRPCCPPTCGHPIIFNHITYVIVFCCSQNKLLAICSMCHLSTSRTEKCIAVTIMLLEEPWPPPFDLQKILHRTKCKILCVDVQRASASGVFIPQTSYQSFAPGPHWGPAIPQFP